MAVNFTCLWVGKSRQHRHFFAEWLKDVRALGEFEIFARAVRKPRPLLVRRIFLERHRDTVRKINARQSLGIGLLVIGRRRSRKPHAGD